jgi:hypothetical protein
VFVLLQISGQKDEGSSTSKFCKDDVVEIMGVADGKKKRWLVLEKWLTWKGPSCMGSQFHKGVSQWKCKRANSTSTFSIAA